MKITKNMTNLDIAELLRAIAASYELKDEIKYKFQIIAYQRAADAIEHESSELKDLWDEGKLEEVPGVGKSIASHLSDLFKSGNSKHFESLMKGLPSQIFDLMVIPGIGAKTAYKLVKKFKSEISIKNPISDLEKLARAGKISKLEGFGKDSEKDILKSISEVQGRTKRLLLPYAVKISEEIIKWMKSNKNVENIDPLGSLRRRASTIGDVDMSVATKNPKEVIEHFVKYPNKVRVLEMGEHTASIILPSDVQVDLMVQSPDTYGSLLQHFTGSKHHNIALREFALKNGLSLSEYGIRNIKTKKLKNIKKEKEFYNTLDLEWIPPELREDSGEIEASKLHKLPKLIELKDILGDFQIHSDFDIETSHDLGMSSMQEIVNKADSLGYEYIAFTEHNPSRSKHKDNQILDILKRKKDIVAKINENLGSKCTLKKVFNSLEIDIQPDGKLPVPEKGLETLDFALVSIHSSFRIDKNKATERIMLALESPKVKIFAHPTARKINEREGIEIDWDKLFKFCKSKNKWLEINADPMRLDLPDFLVREAVKYGVKLTMGTDAHHVDHMDNMIYATYVARRGWVEKKDIINTLPLEEFLKILED